MKPAVAGLSIITPLYGSASTILRCIRSVQDAAECTSFPVEHLLVLDGPDPRAVGSIGAATASPWVDVRVVEKQHSGIADTRNTGLALATAVFVTLLDADDEMTSERLVLVRDRLFEHVAVIGTQALVGSGSGAIPGIWSPRMAENRPMHYLTSIVLPTAWARALGGFDAAFTLGDDWDFVVRLREAGYPIEFRDEVFTVRHVDEANASRDTQRLARDYLLSVRRHRRRLHTERHGQ